MLPQSSSLHLNEVAAQLVTIYSGLEPQFKIDSQPPAPPAYSAAPFLISAWMYIRRHARHSYFSKSIFIVFT